MKRPTISTLRSLLRYDPESGKLFWRERTPEQFQATPRRSPEHSAAQFNGWLAGKEAFTALRNGYLCGCVDYYNTYAHRVIWALQTGAWPTATIDHINGDITDNRWGNLRHATRGEQNRNSKRRVDNKSGVMGVQWNAKRGKWCAKIERQRLGYFDTVEAAAAVRQDAERRLGYHPNHGR